jgi:Carboxypeptidase regulatory-like domain
LLLRPQVHFICSYCFLLRHFCIQSQKAGCCYYCGRAFIDEKAYSRRKANKKIAVKTKKDKTARKFCKGNARIGVFGRASWALAGLSLFLAGVPALAGQNPEAAANPAQPSEPPAAEQRMAPCVSGRIVDQTGVAVVGAKIKLSGQDPAQTQEVLAGEDGLFTFRNVAPGTFHLTFTAAGFAVQEFSGILGAQESFTVPQIVLALATLATEVRVVPPSQVEVAEQQIKEEEKQRALGIIPNFYVTYIPDAAPLIPKQKFELAWKSMVDPITFGLTGAIAGLQQAQNDFGGYGQGGQGYAKRYGAAYGDMVTSTLIGSAILPSLLKQDPRYFYKGSGSKRSRLLYAIANSVICKGDNGHWQPNYSGIIGGLAAGGISNLYYPAKDREGAELTFQNTLIGIGATAAGNILQEFVIRRLTPNAPKTDPGNASKPAGPIARVLGAFVHEGD